MSIFYPALLAIFVTTPVKTLFLKHNQEFHNQKKRWFEANNRTFTQKNEKNKKKRDFNINKCTNTNAIKERR